MTLKKLAEKAGITEKSASGIIVEHHLLNITPESKTKTIDVEIDKDLFKFVNKVAKVLKVDVDSIIVHALTSELEKLNRSTVSGRKNL